MSKMDYDAFAGSFGVWSERFKPFIESEEFSKIYERVKRDGARERIVPCSDNTFKAFARCPSPRVVWYMMDPYPRLYKNRVEQAVGIALDCSNSPDGKLQPSLEIFYDAMEKHAGKVERSPSLDYLLEQGVMLMNTDLTCKLNKTSSHEGVWEPFQKFFLEEAMRGLTGVMYILSGKSSERMEQYINPLGNYVIKTEHPMAAGHKHVPWNDKGVFSIIDKTLKKEGNGRVYWDRREWLRHSEAPF